MIHVGGDNYSDMPLPLGGGGARIACGVIAQAEVNENSQDLNSGDVDNLFTLFYSLLNSPPLQMPHRFHTKLLATMFFI